MVEDTSNDFEPVDLITLQNEEDTGISPMLLLLSPTICNKNNEQFREILKQEFDMDIKSFHDLEVDIYVEIIKKCLIDWQQRDQDRKSTKLNQQYKNIKDYLNSMLDIAKPLAQLELSKIQHKKKKADNTVSGDVILEIYCTRERLNHLIYRKPRNDFSATIFNLHDIEPTCISLQTLSFQSILNFWWTKICLDLPSLKLTRELKYKYKHTLINKVRGENSTVPKDMDTRLYVKTKITRDFYKKCVFRNFNKILIACKDESLFQLLQIVFTVLKKDMEDIPDLVKVPSTFRRFANRYTYSRYLYVENRDSTDPKYDLQLEEVVTPSYQIAIQRLGQYTLKWVVPVHEWLRIECLMCKLTFKGSTELMNLLQNHYETHHQHEPNWQCSNCKNMFSAEFLSENRWSHTC